VRQLVEQLEKDMKSIQSKGRIQSLATSTQLGSTPVHSEPFEGASLLASPTSSAMPSSNTMRSINMYSVPTDEESEIRLQINTIYKQITDSHSLLKTSEEKAHV